MRVLVQITHPAHVHFFRNFIAEAGARGHTVRTIAIDKDVTFDLLEQFGIEYHPVSTGSLIPGTVWGQTRLTLGTLTHIREFRPDVITAVGGTSAAHASAVTDVKSVVWYDTEHATIQNAITYPFVDLLCVPSCYRRPIDRPHLRYDSYQELAYVHPDRFTPDPDVLDRAGVGPDERLTILRMVSWDAIHDRGDAGFDDVERVVQELQDAGSKVLITSEGEEIPASLSTQVADIRAHEMHDLMYYADLFIGESATMATESAVLGTPAIFVSSSTRGYTDELEAEYGMVFNFHGADRQRRGLDRAVEILSDYDPDHWRQRREDILADKLDTTSIMLDLMLDERRITSAIDTSPLIDSTQRKPS